MGPRGLVGPQGNIGPQGVPGPVGPAGPQGPSGPRADTVATYELDEAAGATEFADSSGLSNELAASAGAVAAGDAIAHSGLSVRFTGLEGLFAPAGSEIPDSAQIAPELWIRTSDPGLNYTLLEKPGAYRLRMTGGQLEWTVTTAGGPCTVTHTSFVAADTWVHVTGVYDGLTAAIAHDGVLRSVACRTGRIAPSAAMLTVGGHFDGQAWSEVFRGNLDELRLRVTPQFSVGRAAGGCEAGQAITSLAADGTVTCGAAAPQRILRYNVFDSYLEACCWAANDRASLFGGVNPSTWTNGNGQASQISSDAETLRTLFNKKLYPGKNALVASDRWYDYSSTNGRVTVALLRIKNSTGGPIDWTPQFHFTAYASWGERASIAVNGANVWNTNGNYGMDSTAAVTVTLPANRTSTVIWVVPSSPYWQTGAHGGAYMRITFLAFYNDSLDLPQGLSYVDDLDTLQGNLW